jgi:predicted nucleotidyltransferase component of viral defense system
MPKYTPQQSVELFHLIFMNQLGRKVDKKLYVLKGGCNMRFYFNSIRYSEDIDLDIHTIHKDTLLKNVNQILNSATIKHILQIHGIEILSFTYLKQTATTQRWKISLKLFSSALPLNTKIEFSRREKPQDFLFEPISPLIQRQYGLQPIATNHYSIQAMYEQKILALALRVETQARDIFDLFYLLSSGFQSIKLNKETQDHIQQAISNAMNISYADFKGQVVAYLSDEFRALYDNHQAWDDMVEKVVSSLEENKQ